MSKSASGNVCRTPAGGLANSMLSQVTTQVSQKQNEAPSRRASLRIRRQCQIRANRSRGCSTKEQQLVAPASCGAVKRKLKRIPKCPISSPTKHYLTRSNERFDVSHTASDLTCSCNLDNSDNNNDRCYDYDTKLERSQAAIVSDDQRKKPCENNRSNQDDLGGNQRERTELDRTVSLSRSGASPLRYRNCEIQTLNLGDRNGRNICNKHMPWFGIDVGGSLVKVVFFDPKEATDEELVTLKRIRQYLRSSKPYGSTGRRDAHLEMPNCLINRRIGSLHFIRFATSEMPEFLAMAKSKRFAETLNRTICATGGGACKFEDEIRDNLGIKIHKTDELDSIIYGIHYIDKYNSDRECYFLKDPLDDDKCVKVPYDFSRPYPYLVVNIGSGVGILAVYSSTSYSRISGSSIGGGTFLGLCCLLTQCETFDEAIRLAKAGSSNKVDKLVKDIYGGDYTKFNLSGDTVASNFGHMNLAERRKDVSREDLARALLEMVTINIGSMARMCAVNEGIDRVVFIGNFLRVNQLSMKLLSYAVNYWSKGAIKALFLEHEGYFGAVGCFVESTQGCADC